ncbi:uridine kinase [Intrasporangium sp. YIM S08009]|uniref:uridine kinase n=1 Tax=Intrasporangium zincisolvens TaxID=3080018 RepID=UPI002B05571E|nr:uridine kinase [Intrasporangium sp. YIM S08009]
MRPPVPATGRFEVVRELADDLVALHPGRRVAVGVDGVDGAGKTVLADQLAEVVGARREVLRVSVDGFHRPRAERIARGRGPESFYEDSYDYASFRRAVLEPFRAGLPVTPAVNDVERDEPVTPLPVPVGVDTLLLVDGIFLQRADLADAWDAVVFVDVPFAVSVPRGNARFGQGHDPDPEAEPNSRYVGGQRLYLAEADPRAHATWVLDNTDLDAPVLHRNHD